MKKTISVIIILLMSLSVYPEKKDNGEQEKEYLRRAYEAWKNGDKKTCFDYSNKALKLNAENTLALFFRSKCHLSDKKYGPALKDSSKALDLINKQDKKSDDIKFLKQELLRNKGIIYDSQGKYEEALKEFYAALEVNKESPAVYFDIAIVYYNLKNFDESLKYTESAIDHDPFFEQYYKSAIMFLTMLKSDKNLNYYKERSVLLKNNSEVFFSKIASLLVHMPSENYNKESGIEMYYEVIFNSKGEQILPEIVPIINLDYTAELAIFYDAFTELDGNYMLAKKNTTDKKDKLVIIKAIRIITFYEDPSAKDMHFIYKVKLGELN